MFEQIIALANLEMKLTLTKSKFEILVWTIYFKKFNEINLCVRIIFYFHFNISTNWNQHDKYISKNTKIFESLMHS